MAGGYTVADDGEFGRLTRILGDLQVQVRELGRPTGGQFADQLARLNALYYDLAAEVAALAASGVTWAGPVNTSGALTAAGPVNLVDPYNFDVTTLPGARRTVSVHVSGRFGQTVSTIVKKTNLGQLPFSAADILAVSPYVFEYRAQIDIRDNPNNPYYDAQYEVPTELGMMAEHLLERGMGLFVYMNEDGTAADINYALFGAVASLVIGHDHEARLAALEQQLFPTA